jgi:hypothetical protein
MNLANLTVPYSFKDHVRKFPPVKPLLPLVHTTDGFAFRQILGSGKLTPVKCPVFNEALIYFFYGCPAYKPNVNTSPTSVPGYSPVCLVLAPSCLSNMKLKRIYPFDSGAFENRFYHQHLHGNMALSNFELDTSPDTPGQVVASFHDTNEAYYLGQSPTSKRYGPLEFEAQSYYDLLSSRATTDADERRAIVEIQTELPFIFSKGSLLAAVLPKNYLDDPVVANTLQAWGAEVLTYPVHHARPQMFCQNIFTLLLEFLRGKNYL